MGWKGAGALARLFGMAGAAGLTGLGTTATRVVLVVLLFARFAALCRGSVLFSSLLSLFFLFFWLSFLDLKGLPNLLLLATSSCCGRRRRDWMALRGWLGKGRSWRRGEEGMGRGMAGEEVCRPFVRLEVPSSDSTFFHLCHSHVALMCVLYSS